MDFGAFGFWRETLTLGMYGKSAEWRGAEYGDRVGDSDCMEDMRLEMARWNARQMREYAHACGNGDIEMVT